MHKPLKKRKKRAKLVYMDLNPYLCKRNKFYWHERMRISTLRPMSEFLFFLLPKRKNNN